MMRKLAERLFSWASTLEDEALQQALRTSRLSVLGGHVALMADAHYGLGATVGSVIPTVDALIPAAVGVDIGCGMIAAETSLIASALPDDLSPLIPKLEKAIPAGVGKGHATPTARAQGWLAANPQKLNDALTRKTLEQFGTLGAGNHFFEVCLDERDVVWIVLHSGSRGVGNQLAQQHIKIAQGLMNQLHIVLEDRDLAYLPQGTAEFTAYVGDLNWAQKYALANRQQMMDSASETIFKYVGTGRIESTINCHHNYTQMEHHFGRDVWLTRKGAIKADEGDWGVIPGSMGTRSYIVCGKGDPMSYKSCAHGAGRAMSRTRARKRFTGADLAEKMIGKAWQAANANALVDEIPQAYKDIDVVMEDQKDLVSIVHTLRQILNYKGVN